MPRGGNHYSGLSEERKREMIERSIERSGETRWEGTLRHRAKVMERHNAVVDAVRQAGGEMLLCDLVRATAHLYASANSARQSIQGGLERGGLYPRLRIVRPRYEGAEPRVKWIPPESEDRA